MNKNLKETNEQAMWFSQPHSAVWEQAWRRRRDGFMEVGVLPQQYDEERKGQDGLIQGPDDTIISNGI